MTRIGWFGDTHLGFKQYGLDSREKDFENAFEYVVRDAIHIGVDLLLHAGDIINTTRPSPATMEFLRSMHELAAKNGLVIGVISANHDQTKPHWTEVISVPFDSYPVGGFKMLDRKSIVVGIGVDNVKVYGIPYCSRAEFLQALTEVPDDTDVLLMHQMVKEFVGFEGNNMISVDELPIERIPLIAIGDVHITDIRQHMGTGHFYGYVGSTEMNSESEPENKIWAAIDFEGKQIKQFLKRVIRTRRVVRANIKTDEDVTALISHARAVASELRFLNAPLPIIFIRYPNTLVGAVQRIRAELDPNDYVLRFKPVYVSTKPTESGQVTESNELPELSLSDMLKAQVGNKTHLEKIAAQLIDPNLEKDSVNILIDEFIVTRQAQLVAEAQNS